jgi:hypothetical protein
MNKLIVILSENDVLYKSLVDNLSDAEIDIIHIKNIMDGKKTLSRYHKSIITIIDQWTSDIDFITKYSKYVFSFVPIQLEHSIIFKKPFRITDFIAEIEKSMQNNKLFCVINGYIYDELRSIIHLSDEILLLTTKENAVMKQFLSSKSFFISRDFLLQNIWKYSENSQTTTVESYMNKLRNKLPKTMLEQYKDGYSLDIKAFF